MISSVEALRYRCLNDVRQRIAPFQVLVGPNASGNSTFLDVLRPLALTLLACLDPPRRVFLIEEPENGIHPQAVE